MNKLFLILFVILIISQTFSQSIDGYGIKMGWGFTNHSWEYKPSYDGRLGVVDWENNSGVTARAFADFSFSSLLNVECEIGYAQKGAEYKIFRNAELYKDIRDRLNYLSVSLMGKMKYNLGLFAPYIIFGPEYNYLLNKQVDRVFESDYDKIKRDILGFSVGIGTETKLLPVNIIVEYRYSRDLTNNYDDSTAEIKNFSHSVLIGVKL